MSKMGISTYQSYCGAQIFEAVGLAEEFVNRYFTGTQGVIEGVGLQEVAREAVRRHRQAFGDARCTAKRWTWAASWPIAFAANNTPGPRKPCRCCNMRFAPKVTGSSSATAGP
jgi:hypothetical protein